jgi:hypothetical protein
MSDMERLYIKENKPSRRNRTKEERAYRGCRSNSLKNRMLVITTNKLNKLEWLILP